MRPEEVRHPSSWHVFFEITSTNTLVTAHSLCLHHFTVEKTSRHHRKRARLLLLAFEGGCSFATSITLSLSKTTKYAGFCHLHHSFTIENEDDNDTSRRRTVMTAAGAANADGGSPMPFATITTSVRHRDEVGTLVAPSFRFSTQREGATSLLTLCPRN